MKTRVYGTMEQMNALTNPTQKFLSTLLEDVHPNSSVGVVGARVHGVRVRAVAILQAIVRAATLYDN